jgi:hypothetical protein
MTGREVFLSFSHISKEFGGDIHWKCGAVQTKSNPGMDENVPPSSSCETFFLLD